MQGAIGLFLYVAVMILGSILKKMAEGKARQGRVPLSLDDPQVHTVTLEDMLFDQSPVDDTSVGEIMDTTISEVEIPSQRTPGEFEARDAFGDWELQDDQEEATETLVDPLVPEHPSWAQAFIFAEIIREPRAKRAWPNR